jgi:hypothetical protein
MKLRTISVVLIGSSLSMLLGCATSPKTDSEYGDSVRQMVRSQKVFVPADDTPVDQGDGQRLEAVLGAYRGGEATQDSSTPNSSITINAN